jgi:phosphate transport system protein
MKLASISDSQSQCTRILEHTFQAYMTAEHAATQLAECLTAMSLPACQAVQEAEYELDRLDREIDSLITSAVVQTAPEQTRDLLSSMKMVIDLERVGDLFASVASCARALGNRVPVEDLGDLVKMATVVEKMLSDAHGAFAVRNVDRAVAVIRADAEVDRLRNLVMIRHLEQSTTTSTHNSVQVLFMAQALERAGDHVKNLAEEVCHMATGQTVRHAFTDLQKPIEQMYLDHLRAHHGINPPVATSQVLARENHEE